jgi:hypothetical protein
MSPRIDLPSISDEPIVPIIPDYDDEDEDD